MNLLPLLLSQRVTRRDIEAHIVRPAHVYAVDRRLGLKPGFNRTALVKALKGHVLGQGTTY